MIGRKKQRDSRFFGPETGKVLHIFRYIQSIATSHDLTPNGRVVGQPPHKWPYFRTIQVGETLQFVYILYIIYVYIYIFTCIYTFISYLHLYQKKLILSLVVLPSNSWGILLVLFLGCMDSFHFLVAIQGCDMPLMLITLQPSTILPKGCPVEDENSLLF